MDFVPRVISMFEYPSDWSHHLTVREDLDGLQHLLHRCNVKKVSGVSIGLLLKCLAEVDSDYKLKIGTFPINNSFGARSTKPHTFFMHWTGSQECILMYCSKLNCHQYWHIQLPFKTACDFYWHFLYGCSKQLSLQVDSLQDYLMEKKCIFVSMWNYY